jgi:hypothetical protein
MSFSSIIIFAFVQNGFKANIIIKSRFEKYPAMKKRIFLANRRGIDM